MKLTAAEWNALKPGKRNKYNRSKPEDRTWGNVVFDSKAEMVWAQMHQPAMHKPCRIELPGGIRYEPDFKKWGGSQIGEYFVDVKGTRTPAYNLKVRLYAAMPSGLPLHEVKAKYRGGKIVGFETTRIIVPGSPVPRVKRKSKKARR